MAAKVDLKVSDDELGRLRDKYPAWHIWILRRGACGQRGRAAFRVALAGTPDGR